MGQTLDPEVYGTWFLHEEGAKKIFIMSTLKDGTIIFSTFFRVDGIRDESYIRGIWSVSRPNVMRFCSFDDFGVLSDPGCEDFSYERKGKKLTIVGEANETFTMSYLCEPIRYFASKINPEAVLSGEPVSLEGAEPGGGIYGKWTFGIEEQGELRVANLQITRDKRYSYQFTVGSKVVIDSNGTFQFNGRQILMEDEQTSTKEVIQVKVKGDQLYLYLNTRQILPFLKMGS